MNKITTHVLDVSLGRPAANVSVILEVTVIDRRWTETARASPTATAVCKESVC